MPRIPYAALIVALFVASLTLVGCKSAPQADDRTLNAAVQSKLAADAAIAAEPIQTSVQGGVVMLQGAVSSPAARTLAGSDASQVSGVHSVVNDLTIAVAEQPPVNPPSRGQSQTMPPVIKPSPERAKGTYTAGSRPPVLLPPQPAPIERRPVAPPAPPVAVAPPPPAFRNVTLPAGTPLAVRITQTLDSATTQPGDTFSGALSSDVVIDGVVALPAGAAVSGRVDAVHEAGHYKGSSLLSISLVTVNRTSVSTEPYSKEGTGRGKNTAEKVGGGAAVGAVLGVIFGGGKGAAIGAAAGGGLGAGAQAVTRGQQVQIPSESLIRFRLTNPIEVRVVNRPAADADGNLPRHSAN